MKNLLLLIGCFFIFFANIALAENEWPSGSAMHSGNVAVLEAEMYEQKTSEIMNEIYLMLVLL